MKLEGYLVQKWEKAKAEFAQNADVLNLLEIPLFLSAWYYGLSIESVRKHLGLYFEKDIYIFL